MATARTKTTPENNDLLDQMRKNNRAAHALVEAGFHMIANDRRRSRIADDRGS